MKYPTSFYFWLGIAVLLTVLGYIGLWFILKRPEKWGAWVDKENDFWVRKGLASVRFAERNKRLEKGLPMKLMVGVVPAIGTSGLIYIGVLVVRNWFLSK